MKPENYKFYTIKLYGKNVRTPEKLAKRECKIHTELE